MTTTTMKRNTIKSYKSEVYACLSAGLFMLPTGILIGFPSIMIAQVESPGSDFKASTGQLSSIASVVGISVPIGDIITGYLADRIGRLATIKLGVVPYVVGWTLIALAENVPTMLVGRTLTGIYCAMSGTASHAYIVEISSPKYRGTLMSVSEVFYNLGVLLVYVLGALLHWRTVAWCFVPLCILPMILVRIFCSESPMWLVAKGRDDDALTALRFLSQHNEQPENVERKLEYLIQTQQKDRKRKDYFFLKRLLIGLSEPGGLRPFVILLVLFALVQFSGAYIVIIYTVSMFQSLGADLDPYLCTVGVGALSFIVSIASCSLMRHFGRRSLLLFSATGMTITMFFAGLIKMLIDKGSIKPNVGPAVCLLLFAIFNATGMMNVPWVVPPEVFPVEFKGLAEGLTYAISSLFLTAIVKIYPFLPELMGEYHRVLWLFSGMSLTAVIFIYVFLPETHKKTLPEIQEYFQNNKVYFCRNLKGTSTSVRLEVTGDEVKS